MRACRRLSAGIFLVVLAAAVTPLAAAEASATPATSIRIGIVPRLPAGARVSGTLSSRTPIHLTIALKPRDPAALAWYAEAVSTPGTNVYHHYLTVAQFAARFSPTPAQVSAVESSLRARGLDPGPVPANRMAIPVTASAGAVSRAFSTSLRTYELAGGRRSFATTAAPSIDGRVAGYVQGVIGLDPLAVRRPLDLRRDAVPGRPAVSTPHLATGGPQPCFTATTVARNLPITYTADQIATAYGLSSLYGKGDLGSGQTIALYELEPYSPSDIAAYQACYGTSAAVQSVSIDGGAIGPSEGEAALDIEDLVGLAPAARVLVYSAPNTDAGSYEDWQAIVAQDRAKVVSSSWGECEAQVGLTVARAENGLFQEAAVQGQSIIAASGDFGAENCTDAAGNPLPGLAVNDPASQPYVTGVGGTSLDSVGPPPRETVWNGSSGNPDGGAGGGGISAFWTMPSYQSAASPALNVINGSSSGGPCGAATGRCREVPDVAADADPYTGYLIYSSGQWLGIGGTSAAAPTWAALLALADASPACGASLIGFADPGLYRAAGVAYSSAFNDVVSGSNGYAGSAGYSAGPGYDMASGLGSPNAAVLAGALCDRITVSGPAAQTAVVNTSVDMPVAASSSASAQLRFAATGLPTGLSIDPATGVVSGRPTAVGRYAVKVFVSDADGVLGAASFSWSVVPVGVLLQRPVAQSAIVGHAVRLRIVGAANDGERLTYKATGLPRGLSIDARSGLISGTPRTIGRSTVTVTASIARGASSTVRLTWTIGAAPTPSKATLTGLSTGRPRLSFSLAAGREAPGFDVVRLTLSRGLGFTADVVRRGQGIRLTGTGGRRLKFAGTLAHGVLTLWLHGPVPRVGVSISTPVIHVAPSLSAQIAATRRQRILHVTVYAIDQAGNDIRLVLTVVAS